MHAAPIDLVTVSREFGAGGSDFARALGERLGWPVLDTVLVARVAERLELDPAVVARLDEHPPTRLSRIAAALLISPPDLALSHVGESAPSPLGPDDVADAARAVIAEAVATPPLVVVGHGTQCAYASRPGSFHVRLDAPVDARARRLAPRLGCGAAEAETAARRVDEARGRYVRRYYQRDWRDPLLYDVQFNTARVPVDLAADLVANVVRAAAGAVA